MENITLPGPEKVLDHDAYILACLLSKEVHQLIRDIQIMVNALLHYATIGASITSSLIGWMAPTLSESKC